MDKRKGTLNIIVSVGFKLLTTIAVIIVKRYLIRFCGNEVNGLNSLYLSIIGFLAVAELGVGEAITFCMYRPIVENKRETIAALYGLFNRIYLIVGLIICIAGLLITPFIPYLAKDYEQLNINLYATFLLILISVVATYLYGAKTALIIAHKENYITTTIASIGTILQYALQIIVLFLTKSFEWYLICRILSAIGQGFATDMVVKRKYKDLISDKKHKLDKAIRDELVLKIKAMFMHRVGTLLVNTVDSLIISMFVGVISLGLYSNYNTIKSSMVGVIGLVFSSLTSVLGHLYVRENKEVNRQYCEFFHLLNFMLGMIFFLGYYAVIDNLIELFFSAELVVERSIPAVITMNGFVQFMRNSVLVFRDATGTFYNDRWKPLVEGIANIILSIILVQNIGIVGVIVATIITNLLICHVIEPYILYKNAFSTSPKGYYIRNYSMMLCFLIALMILERRMQTFENVFIELLVNGGFSLCLSIPMCVISTLLLWKNCGPVIVRLFKRSTI